MSDRKKLEKPTVADVIAFLSQFPPDTPFRIEDPDTSWTIELVHAYQDEEAVWLTGEYGEMAP